MPSWGIEPLVELLSHLPDRYSLSLLNLPIYLHRMRPKIETFSTIALRVLKSLKGGLLKKLCEGKQEMKVCIGPLGKLDCLCPNKKNVFS